MGNMIYILGVLVSMGTHRSLALEPLVGDVQQSRRDIAQTTLKYKASTLTATPPTALIPTTPYVCRDILSSSLCNYYSKGCKAQGAQLKWAITYCPMSCGLCTDVTQFPCYDRADCSYYNTPARCRSTTWTDSNCARTCGYCRQDNCYDRDSNCQHLPNEVCTGTFLGWATTNCAKTCGLCHVHTTPAPITRSGSPSPPTSGPRPTIQKVHVPTPVIVG